MTRALAAIRTDPHWKHNASLFVGFGTLFVFALAFIAAFGG